MSALCTLNGLPVFEARITVPRYGVWIASMTVDTQDSLPGSCSILVDGTTFRGTLTQANLSKGAMLAVIVGGAAGITRKAIPRHYVDVPLRIPLQDLVASVGESLSPSCSPAALELPLRSWCVQSMPVGAAISCLLEKYPWRILSDGTLWVGEELWPSSKVKATRWDGDDRQHIRQLTTLEPELRPGEVFQNERVSYVAHYIEPRALRTVYWVEEEA